jgi:uroporphyrin-III C-methyltransferase/precorrin-2 dehydrogenase/sirohydrochlorin ferrochelatase
MRYLPVFVDTRGAIIAVFGGGTEALAKVRLLLKTEGQVTVIAPKLCDELADYAADGQITWHTTDGGILTTAQLAYVATGDHRLDCELAAKARQARVPVNTVDNPVESTVITPAIVDRSPVVVAIGTEGAAPVLARQIKAEMEERLEPELGAFVATTLPHRGRVARQLSAPAKRAVWEAFYAGRGQRAFSAGGASAVAALIDRLVAGSVPRQSGCVALVGAGPGDPELLTLKARKLLHCADVVLYDRLVDRRILELARREATLIEVGKAPEGEGWKQSEIDSLMVVRACAGAFVVRLKSGDPLMFGRADEEMAACRRARVPVTIVPGVTAATAAAASIGVSLTRRQRNSSITFLTARGAEGLAEHDWKALANGASFAIYMGVRAAGFVQGRLLLHGADPATTVTVVENASRPNECIAAGTLAELPALIRAAKITGPAIIFIGLSRPMVAATNTLPFGATEPAVGGN